MHPVGFELSAPAYERQQTHAKEEFQKYEGRIESHEQHFFACELGTADEGQCGGRWNQLLCYP